MGVSQVYGRNDRNIPERRVFDSVTSFPSLFSFWVLLFLTSSCHTHKQAHKRRWSYSAGNICFPFTIFFLIFQLPFSHTLTFLFNYLFQGCMWYCFFFTLNGRVANPNEEHECTVLFEKLAGKKRKLRIFEDTRIFLWSST